MSITPLKNGLDLVSSEIGLLYHMIKLPRMNLDPKMVNYGIWPSNTEYLSGEKFAGRSAGCGYLWDDAVLGTIGETVERYAPAFHNMEESEFSSFKNIPKYALNPDEFALFHEEQYKQDWFKVHEFTEDVELSWFPMTDLTNGKETFVPGQFIYMPFTEDKNIITANISTGLASHTDYHKAILSGLFECVERDSFVLTWMQNLVPEKIKITEEIQDHLNEHFPANYEWHFFDISYDIKVPTVMGFCFGETEFGKFVAVGSSSRATYGESLEKTIQEIGQAIPYFRYLLCDKKDWVPSDDYRMIQSFEEHSIFYTKRLDLWHVFDKWIDAEESKIIDLNEKHKRSDAEEIKHIVGLLKEKNYNVLFKDLTTCDIRQIGFFSIKIFIPQLLQLAGSFPFYYSGGKRLYSVPKEMGYVTNDYNHLNKFPHPFP
jgi:ribosomal protein S12 methylthiotransferase accessory factor